MGILQSISTILIKSPSPLLRSIVLLLYSFILSMASSPLVAYIYIYIYIYILQITSIVLIPNCLSNNPNVKRLNLLSSTINTSEDLTNSYIGYYISGIIYMLTLIKGKFSVCDRSRRPQYTTF